MNKAQPAAGKQNKAVLLALLITAPRMQKQQCSLIIATYNWPQALENCLLSVLAQTRLPDEVIIADDGSGAATAEVIDRLRPQFPVPLIHIWHKDDGFRKTIILNKAVYATSAGYIIQVDGDVILEKHFVADHLKVREPGTFIRGTRAMLNKERTEQLLGSKHIGLSPLSVGVAHRNNALRLPALSFLATRKALSSNSVRGSNFAFWKDDFIKVNGYDNTIAGWGHEDEELAARLVNNGIMKKIVKLRAVQYHLYHKVLPKNNEHQQRDLVEQVKADKVKRCVNGYEQAPEYE